MSVGTIGIVDAGTMGGGIAQVGSGAGFDVILVDVSETAVGKGIAAIARNLDRLVGKGTMTAAQKDAALARITPD